MIILRHAEIYTKSDPVKKRFIQRLVHNVRTALPNTKITKKQWRIYVYAKDEKKAIEKLKRVFGIASISIAEKCKADIKEIKKLAEKIKIKGSFAVKTKRISKNFPMNSKEINIAVAENIDYPVDLKNASTKIYIEVYDEYAYVFTQKIQGMGGLPLGTAGRATCLLENKNDVLACLLMMKRGIKPSIMGKKSLMKKLENYSYGINLKQKDKAYGLAIVSGITDPKEFKKLQKQYDKPLFAPLIGLNSEQLNSLMRKYNLCKKQL